MQDHYATLGVQRDASADEIKRAYRKLARQYHPDVSKEPQAEKRFKEVAQAHEALHDPDSRAAYDEALDRRTRRAPPPGAEAGDLFETLFGARARRRATAMPGEDQHAQLAIDIEQAYTGAEHSFTLAVPGTDALGRRSVQHKRLEVRIPKGVRAGQQLRLAGQGGPGSGGGAAGDLFLEITFRPHPRYRVEDRDVFVDLPLAPWEAALGASVAAATPDGEVRLTVPPGSAADRKLRLRGKGLPGQPAGDLYVVLKVVLPPADDAAAQAAFAALAAAFPGFDARAGAPPAA